MGNLLSTYHKAIYDELYNNIAANTSQYYLFATNPANTADILSSDDFHCEFNPVWKMLFGKKISNNNILPIINYYPWTANTVYTRYDNTQNLSNSQFYVVTPSISGSPYQIFKCIDNANGNPSLYQPDQIQTGTFYKSDGYGWKYITSINATDYSNFGTPLYIPVYPNTGISSAASNNAGIDVVVITNGGNNYNSYHDGIVQFVNTSVLQIAANASIANNFYTNNAVYIYNSYAPTTSQLYLITNYIVNSIGNWVYTNNTINAASITPGVSTYKISPAIMFNTDGIIQPLAYSTINTSSNSVNAVVMINTGKNITRANIYLTSNSYYGNGAQLYPICPPKGGHGYNPAVELDIQGYSIYNTFSNSEANTIPTNITYSGIGIIKNPYIMNVDTTKGSNLYPNTAFNQVLTTNTTITNIFSIGDQVLGSNSGALGIVALSNTSVLYLVGDTGFSNNEIVVSQSNNSITANICINSIGNIYTKDLSPLYVQTVNSVTRSNTQNEAFKLIIQI